MPARTFNECFGPSFPSRAKSSGPEGGAASGFSMGMAGIMDELTAPGCYFGDDGLVVVSSFFHFILTAHSPWRYCNKIQI